MLVLLQIKNQESAKRFVSGMHSVANSQLMDVIGDKPFIGYKRYKDENAITMIIVDGKAYDSCDLFGNRGSGLLVLSGVEVDKHFNITTLNSHNTRKEARAAAIENDQHVIDLRKYADKFDDPEGTVARWWTTGVFAAPDNTKYKLEHITLTKDIEKYRTKLNENNVEFWRLRAVREFETAGVVVRVGDYGGVVTSSCCVPHDDSSWVFEGSVVHQTTMKDSVVYHDSVVNGCNLVKTRIADSDVRFSSIEEADLSFAKVRRSNLTDTTIRNYEINDSTITKSTFRGTMNSGSSIENTVTGSVAAGAFANDGRFVNCHVKTRVRFPALYYYASLETEDDVMNFSHVRNFDSQMQRYTDVVVYRQRETHGGKFAIVSGVIMLGQHDIPVSLLSYLTCYFRNVK